MLCTVGLFISTYSAVWIVTSIFQCKPISGGWDLAVKAECIEISKLWIVMGSLNVLTDVLLLCLPLPQLWKLQMRRATKLQLISIFSSGSLSVTQISNFDTALTGALRQTVSLLFRSIESHRYALCRCLHTTQPGLMSSP